MPNYNAQVPPYSIFPGDVALAFSNEAPAAGKRASSLRCPAMPVFRRMAERFAGRSVSLPLRLR